MVLDLYRIPGSVGQCAWPAEFFKGKKLPVSLGRCQSVRSSVEVIEVSQ